MNNEDDAHWQYKQDGQTAVANRTEPENRQSGQGDQPPPQSPNIVWAAAEYYEHNRGFSWYLLLALATVVITAGIYFVTKDIFAAAIIPIMGIALGVFAVRKPQKLNYELNNSGLRVGEKSYNYGSFRSFSMSKEEGMNCLNLTPLKRFMPPLSVYYEAKDEEKIMDIVGSHLPYEEHKPDQIERLSRYLRF